MVLLTTASEDVADSDNAAAADASDSAVMPALMTVEDFQSLSAERRSEEIFRLLSQLSPFAGEVSALRKSLEAAIRRIDNLELVCQTGGEQVECPDFLIYLLYFLIFHLLSVIH